MIAAIYLFSTVSFLEGAATACLVVAIALVWRPKPDAHMPHARTRFRSEQHPTPARPGLTCSICGRTTDVPQPPGWVGAGDLGPICDRCRIHLDID